MRSLVQRGLIRLALAVAVLFVLAGAAAAAELRGILEPSEEISVSSQVPGIIEEVAVERGDRIQKGQVLVRLKSGVEKAQADLAEARYEFAKRKVQRNADLYQKQLISAQEKDEMETDLKIMEMQYREATEKLKLRTITSPVDGVVVKRILGPGEYVGEGSIMTIDRVDPINVEIIAPAALYGTIRKGMSAEVRPEKPSGSVYRGKVVVVDPVIDAASGTFGIRVELPNPNYAIPVGLGCRVRIYGR
jgi:membrane fusion protein, multidrug efflux system